MLNGLDALDRYPWTGHAGMLGRHLREWHDVDLALGYFGENKREAKACYKQFEGRREGGDTYKLTI